MKFDFRHFLLYGLFLSMVLMVTIMATACSTSPSPATSTPISPSTTVPSTSITPASTPAGSSATSAPNQSLRQGTTGTITSINGNTLSITNLQGNQVTVNVGDNTAIDKTVAGSLADLQPGVFLTVAGAPDTNGNITATSIMIRTQGFSTPPPGATFAPGTRTTRPGNGTGSGFPNGGAGRGTLGTLKSVNGNTLTLTTMQGSDVTVDVNDSTSIQKTIAGTISDLQQGESVTVMGTQDASGNITANVISIRPASQISPNPSPST